MTLETLKGERSVSELVSRFGRHPTMINQWKRALLDGASGVFERGGRKALVIDKGQGSACPDRRAGGGHERRIDGNHTAQCS